MAGEVISVRRQNISGQNRLIEDKARVIGKVVSAWLEVNGKRK
jgi:hypothetical protein